MVGLSVILETRKLGVSESTRQVINKATVMISNHHHHHHHHHRHTSSSLPSPTSKSSQFQTTPSFLDRCFLCGQKLLPGKDIYMYEGDKGFCSVECRCRQIFMDEEETMLEGSCSLAAMKPQNTPTPTSPSSSSSTSPPASRRRKASRNHTGGFAY